MSAPYLPGLLVHPRDDTLANIVPCQLVAAPGGLVVHGSDEPPTVSTVQRKHSEEVRKRTLGAGNHLAVVVGYVRDFLMRLHSVRSSTHE